MKHLVALLLVIIVAIFAHEQHHNQPWPPRPTYPFPPGNWDNFGRPWNPNFPFPGFGGHMPHPWAPPPSFGHPPPNIWWQGYGGYNYADKFAYEFFQRNGLSVSSALFFCESPKTRHISNQSPYLRNWCSHVRKEYGIHSDSVPTYPKPPPQQDGPVYQPPPGGYDDTSFEESPY
uniref:Secreted protein n=1 Tax=Parastrongyloides trichosuri TaxID=131310 RepID=A0A0N5A3V7_PARTI